MPNEKQKTYTYTDLDALLPRWVAAFKAANETPAGHPNHQHNELRLDRIRRMRRAIRQRLQAGRA